MFIYEGATCYNYKPSKGDLDVCLPQFVKAYVATWELTEGAAVLSLEFISLHCKEAKTLCFIESYQQFCSDHYFLDFGEDFQEYLIHLSRRSSVCVKFINFVLPHVMEAKKLCFTGIQLLFCPNQCFLDFGEDVREYLIARICSKTQFCM